MSLHGSDSLRYAAPGPEATSRLSAIAQTAHHHPRAGQEYSRSIRSADVNPISRSRVLLTRLGESLGDQRAGPIMKFLVITGMFRDRGLAQGAVAATRSEAAGFGPNSEGRTMPHLVRAPGRGSPRRSTP